MSNSPSFSLPAGLPRLDRCAVMGVVNVTLDSFSDGGLWHDPAKAIAHGLALRARGADLVDVGGESTRPGARRVPEEEELRRVLPVVRELAGAGVVVSVDTMRASVAEQAVAAGAALVNDVSGGLADPAMARVVAETGAPFVVMHWRGQSADMERLAVYDDVVTDVVGELTGRVEALLAAGVKEEQLVLDPGLGFAKTAEHNWALLGRLDALTALGRPVLVAASRKRFLGTLLADPQTGELRPARERDDATAAVSVLSAQAGAWAVRVHDVSGTADAVRVVAAWQHAARRGVREGL
ncbi:dihydropteroate synthase [Kitasatospora sp. NPDC101176]|uniref:dihydropteroate synthase n=1 Tax=Kitasatospora sp. NPDC101176 TaxID=3364099 RepID=UPI003815EB91